MRNIQDDLVTTSSNGVHPIGTLSGSLQTPLFEETNLWIIGAPRGTTAWQTLGNPVSVSADTSLCETFTIPRTLVDSQVADELSHLTSSTASVTLRGDIDVTWDSSYISYDLPLRLDLPTMFNANLDITIRLGFGVTHRDHESDVEVSIGYDSDVIFTRWEQIGSFGIAGQLEAAIEGMMPLVLECIKNSGEARLMRGILDGVEPYSDRYRLLAIRIVPAGANSEVQIVLCPRI
jgi:hypothetical protein